jgi:hypothetical protein
MSDFRGIHPKTVPVKAGNKGARKTPFTGVEQRRGIRMNSQVRVALEWDSGGGLRRGEAHTRVVGPYGCLVVLPQNLNVDQPIQSGRCGLARK